MTKGVVIRYSVGPTLMGVLVLIGLVLMLSGADVVRPFGETTLYLPMVQTSGRHLPPATAVAASIQLVDAACPNDISINKHSGYVYTTNEESDTVSIIKDEVLLGNISTGDWPIFVRSDPKSRLTYVTNVVDGITVLDGVNKVKEHPPYHESYYITINTVNDYVYISDLHEPVSILTNGDFVQNVWPPDYDGHDIIWQLASDFDRQTGLTYFASWQNGIMTVMDGLEVVDQFYYKGVGAKDMVIDWQRRFIYIANFRAGEDDGSTNNISVVNMDTKQVRKIFTGSKSRHVALDPATGYVYVTNYKNDSVTVLQNGEVVNTYGVGDRPWAVQVDPATGYAYVTNSDDNSVTVFRDGRPLYTMDLPANQGYRPWQIAIDDKTHDVYVLNRSSRNEENDHGGYNEICYDPWVHILR